MILECVHESVGVPIGPNLVSSQHSKGCRLPCSIDPKETKALSVMDTEAEVRDGGKGAVALAEVLYHECVFAKAAWNASRGNALYYEMNG